MTGALSLLVEVWSTAEDPGFEGWVTHAASAGDVNGDGTTDVIVTTELDYAPPGSVRLYFGSPAGLATSAGWTAPTNSWSEGGSDDVVSSVAAAGDVNGDGYDDVILGVEGNPAVVVVLHGGAAEPVEAWTAESPYADGNAFGTSVASAGDVNGDGYADVLVGDDSHDSEFDQAGSAFLYLGSPSGLGPTPAWSAGGGVPLQRFGTSVASAGDVNGDGYADVAVGSLGIFPLQNDVGVDVFLGSPEGLSAVSDWSFALPEDPGPGQYYGLGEQVASAGDVNGDGYDDLVVGAGKDWYWQGSAFLFHGSSTGLGSTPAWSLVGDMPYAGFGQSASSAGDVDGDGYDDVVIGAPGRSDDGGAFVYRGGPAGLALTPAWSAAGADRFGTRFGGLVAGAGDVNGDGLDDVLVSADGSYEKVRADAWVFAGTRDCPTGPDSDGDGSVDACDLCTGNDASLDEDGDRWCVRGIDGAELDCDDTNPEAHPEGVEVCDGTDNDCLAGVPDEELDLDGDGVYPCGGDCDDGDEEIGPYLDEFCGDDLDNNCDGAVDESCSSSSDLRNGGCAATPTSPWWLAPWLAALTLSRRRSTASRYLSAARS